MILRRWRVPEWSAFDDRRTHDELLEVVRAQLVEAGLTFDERDDGRVLALEGGGTLDLRELTTAAAAGPPEAWPETVRGRIASATNPNRPPSDPERLRPAVRVRLMTAEALERFPKELPHRVHADLVEVLVIDSPRALVWADASDLAQLELEEEELFALGRENVRTRERVRTSTVDVDGVPVTVVDGNDDYAASWALLVDELVETPAVVAVPTRGTLLLRTLDDADADPDDADDDDALAGVATLAADRFAAGPGAISPRLYRWRDGALTLRG